MNSWLRKCRCDVSFLSREQVFDSGGDVQVLCPQYVERRSGWEGPRT